MNATDCYYITTAIDYANGPPHIGHALEKIGADVMARYRRQQGRNTHFVIGMDEHGLKVLQSAEERGTTPQEWVDHIAKQFQDAWRRLSISNDDFIRTTEPRHHSGVLAMIQRMKDAGDLYRSGYSGYYCVGCEGYKRPEELERLPDDENTRGRPPYRCPTHPGRQVTWMEEDNWFFRLSRYQEPLLRVLDQRPDFVQPAARRNEIRRVLEDGLDDISVSRSRLAWGIPWPHDPEQTVYVWIDALTNYLSAVGFPEPGYQDFWPAVHVIGKDITRFHCIYWPAMLLSAGVELPESVWAHGFLGFDGRKLSKSEGSWVDLDEAIDRHGPDALRYYLMSEIPWNGDGDFSWDRFDQRYTADLADNVGNLASRTLSMISRYRDGVIPKGNPTSLDESLAKALQRYQELMDAHLLHQGAAQALELASMANVFIEDRAPWKLAREEGRGEALDDTLAALARTLMALACMLKPFMPSRMTALGQSLGLEELPLLGELQGVNLSGQSVHRGDVLFPKQAR